MVKKITKYQCEFPGCDKELYNSEELAKKCESQGVIGPDIRPGFTLGAERGYIISLGNAPKEGHEKKYSFMIIRCSLDDLETYEESSTSPSSSELSISSFKEKISSLESLIEGGQMRLLDDKEFRQLSKFINNSKNMIGVRMELDKEVIKLYRTHSYFNK